MSGSRDEGTAVTGNGPFLSPGVYPKVEILDARRVFPGDATYPDWQVRDAPDEAFESARPFFSVDAYHLRYKKFDGTTSEPVAREIFERGDSVGVLLYNRDTRKVICVSQFRLPTVGRPHHAGTTRAGEGRIVETIAGMVKTDEDPDDTAIRETLEETGYLISKPEHVSTFYSSPGGSSERIHLYFAEVSNRDLKGRGGGDATEDIHVEEFGLDEFRRMLIERRFADPKLIIAGYYVQARLGLYVNVETPMAPGGGPSYVWSGNPNFEIGIRTGDILAVDGIDVWLNPENRYLMMARIIDVGVSASVRWGGAQKDSEGNVVVDTIGNALRIYMAGRTEARSSEVIETTPGALQGKGVRRLLHLPLAEAEGIDRARQGVRVAPDDVPPAVTRALRMVHDGNISPERFFARLRDRLHGRPGECRSVLVPLIGTGEGRLSSSEAVPRILKGITDFYSACPSTAVNRIYLLAYFRRDLDVCKTEIERTGEFTLKR